MTDHKQTTTDEEINRRADRAAVILAGLIADGSPCVPALVAGAANAERTLRRTVATLAARDDAGGA